jgi:hypothetical protein
MRFHLVCYTATLGLGILVGQCDSRSPNKFAREAAGSRTCYYDVKDDLCYCSTRRSDFVIPADKCLPPFREKRGVKG